MFMVFDDIFESIRLELVSGLQVEKLSEREPSQVVTLDDAFELGVLLFQSHHTTSRKHNLQLRVKVVTLSQLVCPVRLLEDLVYKQRSSAVPVELSREIGNATHLKIEIVHINI